MTDRRRSPRPGQTDRRNPLRANARLRPEGPAVDRRQEPVDGHVRVTVKLPQLVVERLRSAVFNTPGLTVAGFIENCISNGVDRMEKRRGRKFPAYKGTLPAGRPKSVK